MAVKATVRPGGSRAEQGSTVDGDRATRQQPRIHQFFRDIFWRWCFSRIIDDWIIFFGDYKWFWCVLGIIIDKQNWVCPSMAVPFSKRLKSTDHHSCRVPGNQPATGATSWTKPPIIRVAITRSKNLLRELWTIHCSWLCCLLRTIPDDMQRSGCEKW